MIEAQILEYMTQHVGPVWIIYFRYAFRDSYPKSKIVLDTLLPEVGSDSLDETKNAKVVLEPQKTYKIRLGTNFD